ncbi:MAG: beta-lactamase family protein [Chloroflexi bacterium]|nr:beta-lactamase family protein [Chloroflexota bacterium]
MRAAGKVDVERIRATVGALVKAHDLPGLAVGVVSGDDLVYAEGFGFADIESRRPQDPALRQRIGSITKTMLGLCTMALVEEGKLSLDDRVVDRLPEVEFQGPAETLAIRHLLTHTGGIGEAPTMDDFLVPHDVLWSDTLLTQTMRHAYPRGISIEATPGTKWAYANHGFALLGQIVAQIEGAPIEEVLHARIFGPLGMTDTDCHDRPHADLTTGYHRVPSDDELDVMALLGRDATAEEPVDGVNIRGRYQYVRPRAAGAVQSSIIDMAKYASALIRKGGGIVQPSTFEEMVSPHWCPDGRLGSVGLTFFRKERFGRQTFGHGGGIVGGWNTHITVVPEAEVAVLTHLNLSFEQFSRVEGGVLQAVLGASGRELPAKLPVAKGILESACGVYEPSPGHLTNFRTTRGTGLVEVSERDGELTLRARRGIWRRGVPMTRATADDPTLFVLDQGEPEPPLVAFTLSPQGAVDGLRFDRLVEMQRVRPRA